MQKIQILFPNPLMERVRELADRLDLPVSEVVRRATESWVNRVPIVSRKQLQIPTVDAGRCLVKAENMRETIYE